MLVSFFRIRVRIRDTGHGLGHEPVSGYGSCWDTGYGKLDTGYGIRGPDTRQGYAPGVGYGIRWLDTGYEARPMDTNSFRVTLTSVWSHFPAFRGTSVFRELCCQNSCLFECCELRSKLRRSFKRSGLLLCCMQTFSLKSVSAGGL